MSLIAYVEVIAGLGWEPEIRGLLTVVLGLAVLGGSVWLLLVTNTGTRLGSLIALAGFWGWMFIMGIFWWIYGIGWVGSLPTWEVQDVFRDEPGIEFDNSGLQQAFIGNVGALPESNCYPDEVTSFPPSGGVAGVSIDATRPWSICTPKAIDLLMAYPGVERELVIQELLNPQQDGSKIKAIADDMFGLQGDDNRELLEAMNPGQRDQVFDALVERRIGEIEEAVRTSNELLAEVDDPRTLGGDALVERIDEAVDNATLRIDDISLSVLQANSTEVTAWAEDQGFLVLDKGNRWNLQNPSQAGEASAAADAFLREDLFPDGNFVVLDAYQQGGKPRRDGNGMWDRIWHTITSSARITHPTNYTVVNVQQTLDKPIDPSKPPPIPEADPDEPLYSVVMIRNLGDLRLIPALFTLASLALFLVTCLVMHWRDLGMREKGLEV